MFGLVDLEVAGEDGLHLLLGQVRVAGAIVSELVGAVGREPEAGTVLGVERLEWQVAYSLPSGVFIA